MTVHLQELYLGGRDFNRVLEDGPDDTFLAHGGGQGAIISEEVFFVRGQQVFQFEGVHVDSASCEVTMNYNE